MVRRRVEIKAIEDKSKRHTTFTKRRQGLQKKTEEYCKKADAVAAMISISKAGNFFGFGYPNFDKIIHRYLADPTSSLAKETAELDEGPSSGRDGDRGETAAAPLMETEKRICEAMESRNWEVAVRNLELEELDELAAEVENIRRRVEARRLEVEARPARGFADGD